MKFRRYTVSVGLESIPGLGPGEYSLDIHSIVTTLSKTRFWNLSLKVIETLKCGANRAPDVPKVTTNTNNEPALDEFARTAPGEFMAGAAAVDITPLDPQNMLLAGFDYNRRCTGVNDPIFARAMVLWDGHVPMVIVTVDLIGLSIERTSYIRSLITRDFSGSVFIVSTHNHQAPDTLGMWGKSLGKRLPIQSGIDSVFMDQVVDGIVSAVKKALLNMRAADVFFASGLFDKKGRWIRNDRSGVLDRRMRLLHVRQPGGGAIATLVQHACHPETLWEDNTLVSGDFCSRCCLGVEKTLGGVALYANGALGAMVTGAIGHDSTMEDRLEFVDELGIQMARSAVRLARRSLKTPIDSPTIKTASTVVELPKEGNPYFQLLVALGVVERRELAGGFLTEMGLAKVGPIFFLGLPGEPSPELGLELLSRIAVDTGFILGLSNDELGYLIPPEFFWDPAYSYERTMSPGPMSSLNLSLGLEDLVRRIYNDRSSK